MAKKQFLPYKYSKSLDLSINDILLNGSPIPEIVDYEKNVIGLFDEDLEGEVKIKASTVIPDSFAKLVPGDERDHPNWEVVAKLDCVSTKYRDGFHLDRGSDEFNWHGEITFHTDNLANKAKVKLYLVRTHPSNSSNGEAKYAYTRLAESNLWHLQLTEPKAPSGQYLDIEWRAFSEHEKLYKHKDSVYFIDIYNSPPKLFLNLETNQLQQLLSSPHKSGSRAYMRDQIIDSIVINIWTVMFMKAAENCENGEEPNIEWQQLILKSISQMLYNQLSAEDAYQKILQEIDEKRNIANFLPEITANLQSFNFAKVDLKGKLEKLIESLYG
ncbi:hypothetical protein LQ318_07165 [Aliifodinibius salicampi]|uniref:Uncharacterized protein n=1 Tax=Fodinibius salicampi TaxID=1920655 RepID=A0ABT3PXU4_9BACT|nr:hypothetical protein [Fodinibius salicampi]MCW9712680.1 hypothetical protein [Fodinibius salicampi]